MTDSNGHLLRWLCPECGVRLRSGASSLDGARDGLVDLVREHLTQRHPADQVNAAAAASWLEGAGHLVELWGGPHDGATVWLPPGPLPDLIGVQAADDGALLPVRSATVRLLLAQHVDSYRRRDDSPRYVWAAR